MTVYHRGIEKFHLLDTEYVVLIAFNSAPQPDVN